MRPGIYIAVFLLCITCAGCLGDLDLDPTHDPDYKYPPSIEVNGNRYITYTLTFSAIYTYTQDVSWDFGDGTSGSGYTTSHTYRTMGTYILGMIPDKDSTRRLTTTLVITQGIKRIEGSRMYHAVYNTDTNATPKSWYLDKELPITVTDEDNISFGADAAIPSFSTPLALSFDRQYKDTLMYRRIMGVDTAYLYYNPTAHYVRVMRSSKQPNGSGGYTYQKVAVYTNK